MWVFKLKCRIMPRCVGWPSRFIHTQRFVDEFPQPQLKIKIYIYQIITKGPVVEYYTAYTTIPQSKSRPHNVLDLMAGQKSRPHKISDLHQHTCWLY